MCTQNEESAKSQRPADRGTSPLSIQESFSALGLTFVLYVLMTSLPSLSSMESYLGIQLIAFALPPFLWSRMKGERLGWCYPKGRDLALSVLLGIATSLFIIYALSPWLLKWLRPSEVSTIKSLLHQSRPISIATLALIPAFAEETLFRGALTRSLAPFHKGVALIFPAFLFALIHFSIARFIPTLCVGLLAGVLVMRKNLSCAFVFHATYNATALFLI